MTTVPATWYLRENWYFLDVEQHDPLWFKFKKGRPGGSSTGSCVGHGDFDQPSDMVDYMSGRREKVFSEKSKKAMALGTEMEPFVRQRYCEKYQVIAIEVGLNIPTWETRLCVSVDGIVINPKSLTKPLEEYDRADLIELAEGIIEIKCPSSNYLTDKLKTNYNLQRRYPQDDKINVNEEPDIWNKRYSYITHTYFDQMQHGMAILRKPWCDFVVYQYGNLYVERIPYCHTYYIQQLLLPIREWLDNCLDPILPPQHRSPLPEKSEFKDGVAICHYLS